MNLQKNDKKYCKKQFPYRIAPDKVLLIKAATANGKTVQQIYDVSATDFDNGNGWKCLSGARMFQSMICKAGKNLKHTKI